MLIPLNELPCSCSSSGFWSRPQSSGFVRGGAEEDLATPESHPEYEDASDSDYVPPLDEK